MYCKHCGARIDGDSQFCPQCGSPVQGTGGFRQQQNWQQPARPFSQPQRQAAWRESGRRAPGPAGRQGPDHSRPCRRWAGGDRRACGAHGGPRGSCA